MVNSDYYRFMREMSRHQSYLAVLDPSDDQLEKQRDMEYVCRFLVHTYVDYDRRLDVEDFITRASSNSQGRPI
jgi:hypothetical protein